MTGVCSPPRPRRGRGRRSFLDKDGACCSGASPELDTAGACCPDGGVDACGVCGGGAVLVDILGQCCAPVADANGVCCASGAVDACGVCDGDGASCATNVLLKVPPPGPRRSRTAAAPAGAANSLQPGTRQAEMLPQTDLDGASNVSTRELFHRPTNGATQQARRRPHTQVAKHSFLKSGSLKSRINPGFTLD